MTATANKVSNEISLGRIAKRLFARHFVPILILGVVIGRTIFDPCSDGNALKCALGVQEWLIILSGGMGLVLLLAGLANFGLSIRICIHFAKKSDFNSQKVKSELIDLLVSTVYCPLGLVLLYYYLQLSGVEIL